MLRTLRGRIRRTRLNSTSHEALLCYLSNRPRIRPGSVLSPAFFRALERSDEGPYRAPRLLIVNYGYNLTYYTPRGPETSYRTAR
jgi:hypothetical protein